MNFGIILLCLLIGCVIGFEFGKYVMGKKIGELLSNMAVSLKKEAEEAQKKRDEAQSRIKQLTDDLLHDLEKMKSERNRKKAAGPDQETVDKIYEIEPTREEDVK